jgi:phosphopantothenoylcysteine synthetase/decarboxylase
LATKKILITAGPTWVAIDDVRVISNIASGYTGIRLAKTLQKKGAAVTLLLGQTPVPCSLPGSKVIRFRFFNELKNTLRELLENNKFDLIIHAAAVSDFAPKARKGRKLHCNSAFSLRLYPLPKILEEIVRFCGRAKVIMFKLEAGVDDRRLQERAVRALRRTKTELVVANRLEPYKAFIMNSQGALAECNSKNRLIATLSRILLRL